VKTFKPAECKEPQRKKQNGLCWKGQEVHSLSSSLNGTVVRQKVISWKFSFSKV